MSILCPRKKRAMRAFATACESFGYAIPDAVCDELDDPLELKEKMTAEQKAKAANKDKRYGCYQQFARILCVSFSCSSNCLLFDSN